MKTLYAATSPVCKASKRRNPVVILLVDRSLAPRSGGVAMPKLPRSFKGEPGDRADLQVGEQRVIAVGCGAIEEGKDESLLWEVAGAATLDALRAYKIESAALSGSLLPLSLTVAEASAPFAMGASIASYRCTAYRTRPAKEHFEVQTLELPAAEWQASEAGRKRAAAINWTRALVDAPANLLTPQTFAQEAQELSALGIEVEVLDVPALERLGAGGLLAVGRGSEHPPCLVVCRWKGRSGKKIDLGLVGKGLTFDGGGLNIKQRPIIEKMKFDMAGAAAVLGALRLLAERRAPVNIVAAIPLAENAIDAKAYRPGDVITSLSGLTIEVDNTDAEGRIVLADAISYLIKNYKPGYLVDIATLTGAIMAALHEEYAGLFSADDGLAAMVEAAAAVSGESVWRLPLSARQDYLVDSEIADVKNVAFAGYLGVGMGSSIGGAKFLERFAGGTRWAHVDIAGTAWATRPKPGIPRGATGFGVRLLDALADQIVTTLKAAAP